MAGTDMIIGSAGSYMNEAAPLDGEAASLKLLGNARVRTRRVGNSGSFGHTFFIATNQLYADSSNCVW